MIDRAQTFADQVRRTAIVEPDDTTSPGDEIVEVVVLTCGVRAVVRMSLSLMDEIPGSKGFVTKALFLAIGDDDITRRRTEESMP